MTVVSFVVYDLKFFILLFILRESITSWMGSTGDENIRKKEPTSNFHIFGATFWSTLKVFLVILRCLTFCVLVVPIRACWLFV